MSEVHGIVYAYHSSPRLGDLTRYRTNASLPFCGRYRLIDFALSSLSNAGVHSVGVIMQRDYQSLLDHLGSGKAWTCRAAAAGCTCCRRSANTRGDYTGTAEALNAVISYVRNIPEPEVVLMPADIVCNLDLAAAIAQHNASGCGITAVCRDDAVTGEHHRYLTDERSRVTKLITSAAAGAGVASMEIYIVNKDVLLGILDFCAQENRFHFHRDGLFEYLGRGGTMDVFLHRGYAVRVDTRGLFCRQHGYAGTAVARLALPGRPPGAHERARGREHVLRRARARGKLPRGRRLLHRGHGHGLHPVPRRARRARAHLSRCIVMQDTCIAADAILQYVIADKNVRIGPAVTLTGCEALPIVIPQGAASSDPPDPVKE